MRLINVKTLALEEPSSDADNCPPYAILSHTWSKEELTLQEWQQSAVAGPPTTASKSEPRVKSGYDKILRACHRAKADKLGYIWCDTVCIDKTSSAELSEAINSMFQWYRGAAVCYGFLADVSRREDVVGSRWMTRGWTLQELLAPRKMVFYSADWTPLGDREELSAQLEEATGIPSMFLHGGSAVYTASIAQRMSWVSRRQTTRVEDMAYCMLGIFDINLPPLYGEGPKAFLRLQEEIIRQTSDQTIFCWTWMPEHVPENWASLLAPSPRVFATAKDCTPFASNVMSEDHVLQTYTIANGNLIISLRGADAYTARFVSFNVARRSAGATGPGIGLLSVPVTGTHRKNPSKNRWVRVPYPPTPIIIRPRPPLPPPRQLVNPSRYISEFELKPSTGWPVPNLEGQPTTAATTRYAVLLVFADADWTHGLRPDSAFNICSQWEPEHSVLYLQHAEGMGVSRGAIDFRYAPGINAHGSDRVRGAALPGSQPQPALGARRLTAFFAAKPNPERGQGCHDFSCDALRVPTETKTLAQRSWTLRGEQAQRHIMRLTEAAQRGDLPRHAAWNNGEADVELDPSEQFIDHDGTVVQVARFDLNGDSGLGRMSRP